MDDNHDAISRYYFESITTKLERTIEKLWILCVILIILLVGSNGAWLYYQSQFQDEVNTETTMIEAEQDGAGKDTQDVFLLLNELMNATAVLAPRLYDSTMRKLTE